LSQRQKNLRGQFFPQAPRRIGGGWARPRFPMANGICAGICLQAGQIRRGPTCIGMMRARLIFWRGRKMEVGRLLRSTLGTPKLTLQPGASVRVHRSQYLHHFCLTTNRRRAGVSSLHRTIYFKEALRQNCPGHKLAAIVNRLDFVLIMHLHSALKAVVGSMRVARRAGPSAAKRATRKRSAAAVTRVTGSVGVRS